MTRRTSVPALLGSAFVLVMVAGPVGAASPEAVVDEFSALPQVAVDELSQLSGGTDSIGVNIVIPTQTLEGNISAPTWTGSISGNNLTDVRGVNSLLYNTGNNVNFNSTIQLNVFLK